MVFAPEMHVHPTGGSGASSIVHSHFGHVRMASQNGHAQIEDNDDHSRAIYLTDFCLVAQAHAVFVALVAEPLEHTPLRAVSTVTAIEQRAHDPPVFSPTHPRSPPA